jgi:outer membrane protein assembly factor BamB
VINAAPVVDRGIVFVASEDRAFYALDAKSGAVRWQVNLARGARGAVVAGGRVFVSAGKELHAYDPDGRLVWSYELTPAIPDDSRRGPGLPVVLDSLVYVGTYTEPSNARTAIERNVVQLVALDRASGALRWSYGVHSAMIPRLLITQGLVAFTATYPEELHAVDAKTGARRWMFRAPGCASNVSDPVLSGGRVVFATNCGIYALDPATGEPAWSAPGRWSTQLFAGAPAHPAFVLATEDSYEQVLALNGASGEKLWSSNVGPESRSLAVGDSLVYAASGSALVGIDRRSGHVVWRRGVGAELSAGPILIDGRACFTSGVAFTSRAFGFKPGKGRLACVDATSGRP